MGRILSEFASLAQDSDPGRAEQYQMIYGDLVEGPHPLPAISANVITRAEFLLHLQTVAGNRLKSEIADHPEHYGGHTMAEIPALFVQTLPGDFDGPLRLPVAWRRIPCTPNQITEEDVISALE